MIQEQSSDSSQANSGVWAKKVDPERVGKDSEPRLSSPALLRQARERGKPLQGKFD